MRSRALALLLVLLTLTGCSAFPLGNGTPLPSALPEWTEVPVSTRTPTLAEGGLLTSTVTAPPPEALRLWVPPQFSPYSGSAAADLLYARLDEFVSQHPGLTLEVRVKAAEGPGGLLDSLSTASSAAPRALPDLIALPRPALETAALKGLLHPYDGLSDALAAPDWYDYARQLARLQTTTYGLPFAGDALLLAYYPGMAGDTPPRDWKMTLEGGAALVFPAAEAQSLFTLAQYQALGGPVQDEQGRPMLDALTLTEVFTFYHTAALSGILPSSLALYANDDQSWSTFTQQQAAMAITWASHALDELPEGASLAPLVTPRGTPFTLATGWAWGLAAGQPERQQLAAELAEFLVESDFLARWTRAVGYLPPRSAALQGWHDSQLQALIGSVSSSARLCPSMDVLSSLGPVLGRVTVQVIKLEADPFTAAQAASGALHTP